MIGSVSRPPWSTVLLASVLVSVASFTPAASLAAASVSHSDRGPHSDRGWLERGLETLATGDAERALAQDLLPALARARAEADLPTLVRALGAVGHAELMLGMNAQASEHLAEAVARTQSADAGTRGHLLRLLALAESARGMHPQAIDHIDLAIELMTAVSDPATPTLVSAEFANDSGLVQAAAGRRLGSERAFTQALEQAETLGLADLAATAAMNLMRGNIDRNNLDNIDDLARRTEHAMSLLSNSARLAAQTLDFAVLLEDAAAAAGRGDDLTDRVGRFSAESYYAYRRAMQMAAEAGDQRTLSFALGHLGAVYEDAERHEEAIGYTERALLAARAANADDSLYRWQWQLARLARDTDDTETALANYRAALATVAAIQMDLAAGRFSAYREEIEPLYQQFADLALSTTRAQSIEAAQPLLHEVRSALEGLKLAEVQDYFEDQCVVLSETADLDQLAADSAVVYPVILPDRLELLVSIAGRLHQYTSNVGQRDLTRAVRAFRRGIETPTGSDYMEPGQQLYGWLVAPMAADLEARGVNTLVFVPDGSLRTIPISALHDGEQFLIERFAIATTPGLSLTSGESLDRSTASVVVHGLTESVQGYAALPEVANEVAQISAQFPSSVYTNSEFLASTVETQLAQGDFSVVHIATHGEFNSDHTRSFLLAYDDRITLDRLQEVISLRQFQDQPVELLVLSACQTAAGDDRAALGLAGVALKAGARSALATLWYISDESTSLLIADFYEALRDPSLSKAQALQVAQVALLADERYRHPSLWAPFLLIGNWL